MDYQLGPGPLQVDQNTIDEKIKGDIGIVENGDVATHAIPSGYYVIWKGDLYVAKTDISSGTTLSTSNLTAKPNGLGADVATLKTAITPSGLKNGNIDTYFDRDVCWIQSANSSGSQPGFNYYQLEIIPNGNGQVVQRATEMSNARIANRLYANGAWSPWEPVALNREITALNSKFILQAIDITYESGITGNLFGRKKNESNPVVTINGYVNFTNAPTTSDMLIATLPTGSRPISPVRFTGALAPEAYLAPAAFAYVIIDTDGKILISPPSGNTLKSIYFSCAYHAQN